MRIPFTDIEISRSKRPAQAHVLSTQQPQVEQYGLLAQTATVDGAQLETRQYISHAAESYPMLPELSPMQIRGLLWSAMRGDFGAAYDLFSMIQDTAPRFLINLHQVRELAARATIKIHASSYSGKKPSLKATERRDFIDWALQQFQPNPQDDESGMADTIYDQLGSMLQPHVSEIMYHQRDGLWTPRATAWISPRKYALDDDRRLGLVPWREFGMGPPEVRAIDPVKFLTSIYKTRSGSMTMSGIGRPLGWWWGAMMFGRKWLLQTAQRFSIPFMHIKYATGTSAADIATLQQLAAQWGANGHAETIDSIAIDFIESNWNAQNNPQDWLIEKFDYYCDLMILRETRASDIGRSTIKGGSAQAGEMKDTQVECVEAVVQFACATALDQLIRNLCILNYGDADECPYAWPDFTRATTPKEKADVTLVLKQAGWVRSQTEMQEEFNMELEPAPEPAAGGFNPESDIVTRRREYWRQLDRTGNGNGISAEDAGGVWRTIRGTPVFIEDGQSVADAVKEKFGDRTAVAAPEDRPQKSDARQDMEIASPSASSDQVRKYEATRQAVLDAMPASARDRVREHIGQVRYHGDIADVSAAFIDQQKARGIWDGEKPRVGGFVQMDKQTGKMHVNLDGGLGSHIDEREVYAHEFAHVVDGPAFSLSNSAEWKSAWQREIKPGLKLSRYAATKPSEGFAEFGRLIYGGAADLKMVEKRMPKSFRFWKERGLL